MSRFIRGVAVLSALALLAGACGDDDDDGGDAAATTTTESDGGRQGGAQAVSITAVDYAFSEVPEQLTAGVVDLSFQNEGEVAHDAAFLEIGDTPLEQFLEDFPPVLEGGPFPDYVQAVAAPVEVDSGQSTDVTFTLSEGTYALICTLDGDAEAAAGEGEGDATTTTGDGEGGTTTTSAGGEGDEEAVDDDPQGVSTEGEGEATEGEGPGEAPPGPPHFQRGMATTVEVGPGDAGATLPEADGSVTAVDYDFQTDISAGDTAINFVNEGPEQVHFASVSVFPEGTDAAAAEEAFAQLLETQADETQGQGPPPEGVPVPEDVGFSGIFSTGLGATFELFEGAAFESGRTYLLACFIQDRSGGPPHAIANQQYTAFTVE